jgi:hypothetical protein
MHWVAPSGRDTASDSSAELRASGCPSATQPCQPILGLIFLRCVEATELGKGRSVVEVRLSRVGKVGLPAN